MEKIIGTVSNIRNTISVNGGGENSQVTTTHIAMFQISGHHIKAKSSEPLMISDGDDMVVVGAVKRGIFNALAHKNLTTCVEDNEGWILRLISGVVMPCIGFFAINAFTTNSFSVPSEPFIFRVLPKIVGAAFFAFGIYNLYCSVRVIQAINQLRKEIP